MTRANMAIAELALAANGTAGVPRDRLDAALAHVEAALTVYDPEHMPYDHGMATRLREDILARLAALDGAPDTDDA